MPSRRLVARCFTRILAAVFLTSTAVAVAACARDPVSRRTAHPTSPSVATSPRVADDGHLIRKGGGTYKIGKPYQIGGKWYVPREEPGYDREGVASWYGDDFHGRLTANGEVYDMWSLTAAHPTLPLPSYAYVTNLDNGRTLLVRINDRGPYAHDRLIDLSRLVARQLGSETRGLTRVRVVYAGPAPLDGNDRAERDFLAAQPWSRGAPLMALQPRVPYAALAR
jgi:rare lipoprotein A